MTIVTGQLLLCDHPGVARIAPGFIRIADGMITEVVEGEIASKANFGDANTLITPGFIDAHMHLPQFDMIGAHGMPLLKWLQDVTFPSERKWEDSGYAAEMTARVVHQCLAVGTTAICAYGTVHHEGTLAALKTVQDAGMRGVIGQVLMNRKAPDYLCRETDQLIDEAKQTLEQFPPGSRVAAAVTPRFAISCTPDLLNGAGRLAQDHDAIVQTHLAETKPECDLVRQLFDDQKYVSVYRQTKLLTKQTIFGHGIHLDADDRKQLRDSGSIIAHCPTANSFLRSGTMNRDILAGDGVRIALGSDIGAGYERCMVRVARAMIEAAALIGDSYPTPAEAWYQITAGTADVLNWQDAGRIAINNPADIVVIQPDIPWLNGTVDPLSMAMFAWDDRWIKRTLLRGE